MNEQDRYKAAMESLERQLVEIDEKLQLIADHFLKEAVAASPEEYRSSGLGVLHQKLTERTDAIINRMQTLHSEFVRRGGGQ